MNRSSRDNAADRNRDCNIPGKKLAFHAEILNNISDAVITVDVHGKITSWNLTAGEIYGFDEMEVLGRDIFNVLDTVFANDKTGHL